MCVTERQAKGNWTKGLKYAYLRNIFGQNWPQNQMAMQRFVKKSDNSYRFVLFSFKELFKESFDFDHQLYAVASILLYVKPTFCKN